MKQDNKLKKRKKNIKVGALSLEPLPLDSSQSRVADQ
jgi:hypothetical protein